MIAWQRNINALAILALFGVLLSAFGVQFLEHEEPCPLCMLQRIGMIGVASSLLLNIKFGMHTSHYALALLSSLVGGTVALRQISLHVCPGFPEFGMPVLGLSLYTWSFIVFACSILGVAILLFLMDVKSAEEARVEAEKHPWNALTTVALFAILSITAANIFTTYMQCGFGPCQD